MEHKAVYQQFNDFVFLWRGYLCRLFQKGLALGLTFNVLLLVRDGIVASLGIQAHGVAVAFGTGVVFAIPENGILHGSERHSLELHASRRIAEILLHSGEIPENHNIVEIIHRETPVAEKVNHQIVVLLCKLSFLLCHRTQRPHVYHFYQLVK